MGFLDFWARRPNPAAEPELLQARAYNAMLPSEPPILGTYPVAGNGQNILEQFQKAHPQIDVFDQSAPPPAIPRMRGGSGSLGRPSTAPSNNNKTLGSSHSNPPLPLARPSVPRTTDVAKALPPTPKSEKPAPKGLTVDVPGKKRLGPPYKLPPKSPSQASFRSDNYILGAPSPRLLPPDAAATASIRSGTSQQSKGHMDLLDYHSALGTSDFYGRVQAGGTKNYGEDVADRNMGQNGVELKSSKARQFYSKNFGRGAPVDTRTASFAEEVPDETPRRSRSSKHSSMGSSTRSKSLTSNNVHEEPQRKKTPSRVPPIPAEYLRGQSSQKNELKTATRRKSMPSYAPAPTSRASSTRSQRRMEREKEERERERREREAQFPDSLRDRAAAADYYNSEDDDYYGTDSSTSSSPPPPPPPKYKKSHSPKRNRTSLRQTAESNPRNFVNHRRDNTMVYREDWGNSSNRAPRHDTVSSNPSVRTSKSFSNRHSLHNVRSSDDFEQAAEHRRSGRNQATTNRHRSMRRDLGSNTEAQASPLESLLQEPAQPRPVTSYARMTNHAGQQQRPRAKSTQSTGSGKNGTHLNVDDSIPERSSSIRNWSMTSGTATTTTQSSNIFRPHSSHTCNTSISIDLTPFPQLSKAGSANQTIPSSLSHSTLPEDLILSSTIPDIPPFVSNQPFKPHAQKDLLRFDDGTSVYSDASSSVHEEHKNSEEGLLFNDHTFGQDAFHLPGLFGANDSESAAESPIAQGQQSAVPTFHLDNFSSFNDGTSESAYFDEDNLDLDIPFRRSDANHNSIPKDNGRFRGGSSPIMEEIDSLTSMSDEDPMPKDKGKGKAVAIGAY